MLLAPSRVRRGSCWRLLVPKAPLIVTFGQISQTPLDAGQVAGKRFKVQQSNSPATPLTVSSVISNVQVPLTSAPDLPRKSLNLPSGRNVPKNGATPLVMGVAAASSKVVRWAQLLP